jgi:hypothetical protein
MATKLCAIGSEMTTRRKYTCVVLFILRTCLHARMHRHTKGTRRHTHTHSVDVHEIIPFQKS